MNKMLYYGFDFILCYTVLGYPRVITKFFITEQDAKDYLGTVDNLITYRIYKANGDVVNV